MTPEKVEQALMWDSFDVWWRVANESSEAQWNITLLDAGCDPELWVHHYEAMDNPTKVVQEWGEDEEARIRELLPRDDPFWGIDTV